MEYKPQDAMFNIDCNGEYVKNHKTLIIVRCRHLKINSYHGYKDFVMHNWKLFDMWSIISRIFFRTSMEMQSYNAWRSIVVWRFNFVPTSFLDFYYFIENLTRWQCVNLLNSVSSSDYLLLSFSTLLQLFHWKMKTIV
jgi:hypothetical protein